MSYPSTYDNLPNVVDTVTNAAQAVVNPWIAAMNAIETYVGLSGDVAASSGTLTSQIKYLLAAPGGIAKQDSAPSSPATNDLWIETDQTTRPISIFYSAAWHLIGANALTLQGFTVHTATPTNGQVLTWDNANSRWAPAAPTGGLTDPMTTAYDLIYRDGTNTTTRLPIGTAGQFLGVSGAAVSWITPSFVPAPGTPQQGDILYYDGTTWTRLGPGTTGQFLKTLGPSTNPLWATPPSAAPGDGIPAPAGQAQGQVLYYNGTIWTGLAVGTSGQFLKTNGAGANPSWATPSSGFTNPMTTLADLIVGDTGGTAIRLSYGGAGASDGKFLKGVSGSPAWSTLGGALVDTFLEFTEASAPSSPASGKGRFYVLSSDSHPYFKGDDGVAHDLLATGTGYSTIQHNAIGLTARATANLIDGDGMRIDVADNVGQTRTDITIRGRWSRALAFA